jgi:membrane protease YdiL (CAAX protease family)
MEAKSAVTLEAVGSTRAAAARTRAIRRYRAAIAAAPEAPRFRRELGLLLGATGDRRAALVELRQTAAALRRLGLGERAKEEAALWPAIFGDPPPRPAAVPALRARVEALSLGWFRHLALEALYRRAGMREAAETERRAARREALSQQVALGLLGLGMAVAGLLGLVIGGVFLVKVARGAWRPAGGVYPGPAFLLWEAFLLFLALNAAGTLLRGLLPGRIQPAGPAAAGSVIGWILAGELLALLPLAYLAVALRRRGLSLAAIGLTARNAAAEAGRGIAGYAAMLPWVFLVAVVSQWAGRQLFPDVAPPFHPVQALTVAAPSAWARVALFLIVAVGAPLWEEIFFRGVLFGALRRRYGAVAAGAGSAALFALLHPQLPLGFLPIFFIGAFLAAIYEWRRSLLPGMVLHALHNGVIFLMLSLLFPPAG